MQLAKGVIDYLETHRADMLDLLGRLVNIDSGTYDKAGVDRVGAVVRQELESLGFTFRVVERDEGGNHLVGTRSGDGRGRLLLAIHLDTVCPKGSAADRPFTVTRDRATGPGVADMKGGVAQMIYALKALRAANATGLPALTVVCTGDEEIGTPTGRPVVEAEAKGCDWAFVFEPGRADGSLVAGRWAVGAFYLTITGRTAHVANMTDPGVNACTELAHKVLALEGLTDLERGIKVSVNLVQGGTARQVAAEKATAHIDVRVRSQADADRVAARVKEIALAPVTKGVELRLDGRITRPAMEATPASAALLKVATEVGQEIGMTLGTVISAGGSDGSFTANMGVPTLDGLGPIGHEVCSTREWADVSSLVPRTALVALTAARLGRL